MDKEKKNEIIVEIRKMMDSACALYLIDFHSLTVKEADDLRNEFFKVGIKYKVVKNTLALRALKESKIYSEFRENLTEFFKGQTGIIFVYEDPVLPAKILKKFSEKIQRPKLKAAVVENQLYGTGTLDKLASLASKDEIMAGILACINSPVSGIIGSINATIRDLASVIEEIAKKKAA